MDKSTIQTQHRFLCSLKDPGSAISHLVGTILAILGAFPLLVKASHTDDARTVLSMLVFSISLFLLYLASTLYHSVIACDKVDRRLKKFDHCMIYVLIAGTYTPICTLVLGGKTGLFLLLFIWSIAIIGQVITYYFVYCPKWINSIIYISMGWAVLLAFRPVVLGIGPDGFGWLLAGGIIYTVGGIIYALKLPLFNDRHKYFGSHEIFHIFCLAGSICHYILMYCFILH